MATITAVMLAFRASSNMAGANATSSGKASGSTSGGAFIGRIKGPAAVAATRATVSPIQPLAPSTTHATTSARALCPSPSACVMTTPTPCTTMRNTMNSVPKTWCARANAAPDASDIRAARAVLRPR